MLKSNLKLFIVLQKFFKIFTGEKKKMSLLSDRNRIIHGR